MALDTRVWLEFAQTDLAVAHHLMDTMHPKPLEVICYHCQQCAEKAIKAVYIALNLPGGLPKKHDLSFLLEQMKNRVPVSDEVLDHADELNPYGIVVRYPSHIEVEEYHAARAMRFAEEFLAWAKNAINQ